MTEQRARALLDQLTLDEKLSMMDGDMPFWRGLHAMVFKDLYHRQPWRAGVLPRLGIEGVRFIDGPRGVVLEGGATTFPVTMARGAAWDPQLEEKIGDAIGRELRSHGGNLFGGVCVNLLRHPAWGRAQETYGEDPVHVGELGAALVRGVQRHAMACVKHYALNSIENARFSVDVSISQRALHELYLPHFKTCIDAGAAAVMSAYNAVNGQWCGQSPALLTDILKQRWGFEGFVVTDFIFGLRDARQGALAGQDLEMPFRMVYAQGLRGLVDSGEVPVARIDDAVLRILRQQLKLPSEEAYPNSLRACAEHRALAREAAAKSIVLLKNEGELLPLDADRSLALIGHLAATANLGDRGSSDGRPEYVVTPLDGLREALGDRLSYADGAVLSEAQQLARAADAALVVVGYTHCDEGERIEPSDLSSFVPLFPPPRQLRRWPRLQRLFAAGLQRLLKRLRGRALERFTGDGGAFGAGGDRERLGLRPADVALIDAVAAANPNTIVAIMAGSTVVSESWDDSAAALLMLWYPGMEGGHALADIVLGRVNPSGKMPFATPADGAQLPHFDPNATAITYDLWHGYRKLHRDEQTAAFPFGFGKSYTSYRYADLALGSRHLAADGTLEVSFSLSNTGARAGEEVVQLYVSAIDSQVERPLRELKAFARVALEPGESKRVALSLPAAKLAYFDEAADDFVVEAIDYELLVGAHADDPAGLQERFVVAKLPPQ